MILRESCVMLGSPEVLSISWSHSLMLQCRLNVEILQIVFCYVCSSLTMKEYNRRLTSYVKILYRLYFGINVQDQGKEGLLIYAVLRGLVCSPLESKVQELV